MSLLQTQVEPAAERWDENDWDDLLEYIEDGRVIPIIGPDLLNVESDGVRTSLSQYLATQLAARFKLEGAPSSGWTLNDVVCCLGQQEDRKKIYTAISSLLRSSAFPSPRPLQQLAEIRHFNLYVSTTFDSMLEQSLNEVRYGGGAGATSIAYAPNDVEDLPHDIDANGAPTVYHLFGRYSTTPSYVVCDEDMLEFLCALQSENRRPERLFDELKQHHLLILGASYPDWLARFFLRTTRQYRLRDTRDYTEYVADSRTFLDSSLVFFLQHFSRPTRIFAQAGAIEFVDELWRRWRERNPPPAVPQPAPLPMPAEMPAGAVFISYASEDVEAVRMLKAGLDELGVVAWFDKDQLRAGDAFKSKIERSISRSYFIAVLSRNTGDRERFFRQEWRLAIERSHRIFQGDTFIIPVIVDSTSRSELARVPDEFLALQLTHLAGGRITPEFANTIRSLTGGQA